MTHVRFNRMDQCRYSIAASGDIFVEHIETGETGVFDEYGAYKSGELRQADVQMCQFVAKLGKHRPEA